MPTPVWAAALYTAIVIVLGSTYVWSNDPGRRQRAFRLLRRLFGRR